MTLCPDWPSNPKLETGDLKLDAQFDTTRSSLRSLVVEGNRSASTAAFESEVVGFFVEAAELLGVPKSLAAIYGIIFASPLPLSFADIGARLDLSKGSISQGLRTLRDVGAIQEVSKPADPAELFIPDLEMRRLIARYLSGSVEPQLKSGKQRLKSLEARLVELSDQHRKPLGIRLKKLGRWHSKTRSLLPIVRTFLAVI